jgi:hypothetical protein
MIVPSGKESAKYSISAFVPDLVAEIPPSLPLVATIVPKEVGLDRPTRDA